MFFCMLGIDQIRFWQRLVFCGLLGVVLQRPTAAKADTSTATQKTTHTSTTHSASAKRSTSTHTTSKGSSSHSSGQGTAYTSAHSSPHTSAQKSKSAHGKKRSKQVAKKRGQQGIDSARAREIQEALIREHYMDGEPSGTWDAATQAAMQRYQTDQGWQSKTTPDSRALIKLGLGPNHDHLLNPESAMTAAPAAGDTKAAAKPSTSPENLPQQ